MIFSGTLTEACDGATVSVSTKQVGALSIITARFEKDGVEAQEIAAAPDQWRRIVSLVDTNLQLVDRAAAKLALDEEMQEPEHY